MQMAILHTMVHISGVRFQADQKKSNKVFACSFAFFDKLCIESACRCDRVENNYGWIEELWMTF